MTLESFTRDILISIKKGKREILSEREREFCVLDSTLYVTVSTELLKTT